MPAVAGNTIRQKKFGGLNSKRRIEHVSYDKQTQILLSKRVNELKGK